MEQEPPIGNCPYCQNPVYDSGPKFYNPAFHDEAFYCSQQCIHAAMKEEEERRTED